MLQSGLGQLVVDELLTQRGRPPRSRYLFKHALIQDAAYQSLLKRTRQQYHERVAKLLEDRFPEVASTQPELVAHHYTEANCPEQAIAYWHKAGAAAARQSANLEAIDQFRRGLALVQALSEMRERAERELDLQMALGPALYATKVRGHPDIGRTYARAWGALSAAGWLFPRVHVAPRPVSPPFKLTRIGKGAAFRRGGDACRRTARRCGPSRRGPIALAATLFWQGKLEPAFEQFRRGPEMFDPNMQFPDWPGAHPRVLCQIHLTVISWILGYPDRSLAELRAAGRSAETPRTR